ncbi:MAG: M4 family metallopeptidase [Salinivirgaceae bacterium]|nr:M4 family metallopeptidase [Salinivirgaceae bacterium]
MKKIYQRTFLLVLSCIVGFSLFAQNFEKQTVDRNGYPTFVKFNTKEKAISKSETNAILSSAFNLTKSDEFKSFRTEKDNIDWTHERFQQYYKGIKVENGVCIVHSHDGILESLSGEFKLINEINTTPAFAEEVAIKKAKAFVNAEEYMWEQDKTYKPTTELVVVAHDYGKHPKDVHQMVLAYKVDIYASKPLSRNYIYVNAQTGEVVHVNARIHRANATGSADTRYSGTKSISTDSYNSSYRLRDYSRGNGIITYNCNESTSYTSAVDFTDANNSWTAAEYNNADKDNGALDAHWAGMMTYDYFTDVHGRNSFDGNGALMKTYVHFDSNYDNAYWNGSVFTFGDGSSFDILTSLDVFGHEFGHAVCSYTADLTYQNEEGALNEAFSDIWGCAIEYRYAPEKDNWLMGEDLGSALRSISDPKSKGLPDTYNGTNWAALSSSPSQYNDYGGVHTNNGPFCYWFYLISEGGTGTNDNGDSYTVSGIGIDKAEQITFRIESQYMTSSSDYADARTYAIQAAQDLYGADSQEEISVTNAMYAVGVGSAYGPTVPEYCASKGSDFSYEWIAGVTVGSFTKTSAGTAYSDYTSSVIDLTPGQSYAVSLVPGFASTTYNEYWKIWIDYNGDLDFSDAGELVFDAGSVSKVTVNGNFTVSSSASGQTRMRVSMKYDGAQTECETFGYGEVEDYTVSFVTGGDYEAPTAPTSLAASNITQTTVDLSWTASSDNVGVTGYDVYQGSTVLGTVTGTSANITGLTANTSYTFYIKAKDAAGNISSASNTLNVTTSPDVDTEAPTAPANLAASNVAQTSLSLTWSASTDNVGVASYDVYKGGSVIANVSGTSKSVTGLTANTAYSFYVKAKDAAGNVSSASSTVNVTTLPETGGDCVNGITLPYSESFESSTGVWEQATNDNLNWTRDASGTPSSSTGPSTGSDGSYYLYVESSTSGTGFPSKKAILNSPCIDLTAESAAMFTFDYHMYGTSMGSLSFEIGTDGVNYTSVWSKSGNLGNAWASATIDLSAYSGSVIYARFVGTTGSSYTSDMAIDNIEISNGTTPDCYTVNLTLVFDNYPEETSWTIKNSGGTTVASGGTYASQADGSTLVETACLDAGCYTFTINDAYGDGMCCSYGNGSYSLADAGGSVLASGASYTSSQATNFCLATQSFFGPNEVVTEELVPSFEIYPNPVNDYLNVVIANDVIKTVKVINLQGSIVNIELNNDRIDVSQLKAGMYFISIETENQSILERFIKE